MNPVVRAVRHDVKARAACRSHDVVGGFGVCCLTLLLRSHGVFGGFGVWGLEFGVSPFCLPKRGPFTTQLLNDGCERLGIHAALYLGFRV